MNSYFAGDDTLQIAKWVKRLIARESSFNPSAENEGAIGLMGMRNPAFNDVLDRDTGGTPTPTSSPRGTKTAKDRKDPDTSLDMGVHYLQMISESLSRQDSNRGWDTTWRERWALVFAGWVAGYQGVREERWSWWTEQHSTPTPVLPKGIARTPTPTCTPTRSPLRTVLWSDISGRQNMKKVPTGYVEAVMGSWKDNPMPQVKPK